MIPLNPWEHQNAIKTLYSRCVEEVCQKHQLTRMELDILLFLANNPRFDTATDIVEMRYLSKSQVSVSVRALEKRGYLRKRYADGNRKTVHLSLCEAARGIITDGRAAQERFIAIAHRGLKEEETESIRRYIKKICNNINDYLKEEAE